MSNVWSKLINLTRNVTGVLPIANGGTNKALTLAAGGVIWSDADSFEVSAAGTAGQLLTSTGTTAPVWATPNLVSSKSADYTITDTDGIATVLMTTGGSNATVTLPTATDNVNRIVRLKKIDNGAGFAILDGEGAELIDNLATVVLMAEDESVTVQCNGTGWDIIAAIPQATVSNAVTNVNFTGTATTENLTTVALQPGKWQINAGYLIRNDASGSAVTAWGFGISANSASFTGTTPGSSQMTVDNTTYPTTNNAFIESANAFRTVVLTSAATYYVIGNATWTSNTPQYYAAVEAVRIGL